jgi:hypothetical protein
VRQENQTPFQGDRCNPNVIHLDVYATQVPLRICTDRGGMCTPNPFHYQSVVIPSRALKWVDELGNLIFNESATLCTPLRIRICRYAQTRLNFSQNNWAHP